MIIDLEAINRSLTRKLLSRAWFIPVWLLTCNLASAAGLIYSLHDLGPISELPGRSDSGAKSINRFGQVAGANAIAGAYQAILYGGAWTNLGTLGGSEALASSLNNGLRVAGYSLNAASINHAFLWTPGANNGVPTNPQMIDLGTLGGSESQAFAINNSGQITGFAQTDANEHAFLYSGGVMTDIGSLVKNLPNSFGYSINEIGQIAITAYNSSYNIPHALFYDGNTVIDLDTLGGQGASALAINNNSWIAGYATTSAGVEHGFVYHNGSMIDLGTLGGSYSYANALNNSNSIVGGTFTDPADSVYHAFIFTNNVMIDLNSKLDSTGAGWILVEARAINDAGQITGTGTLGGQTHAFLLTPVTPPIIQLSPTNQIVNCGDAVTLTVLATPSPLAFQWYQGQPPQGTPLPGLSTNSITLTNPVSSNSYYVIVTNSAGRATSSVASVTVRDILPPLFTSPPTNLLVFTEPGKCTASVQWPDPVATDVCDGVVPVRSTPRNGSIFNLGETTVICTAADLSGNSNTCSFTITVVDKEAPVLSNCPSNRLVVFTEPGKCTASVQWLDPVATDICDGVVPVRSTPRNGSIFNLGETTVICTAADLSGNSNTCSFTVAVVDRTPPVLSNCPTNRLLVFTEPGKCSASVQWPEPIATDACDGLLPVHSTPRNGSIFNLGETTVICTAADSSGNSNTCTFIVAVVDTEAPVLSNCPTNRIVVFTEPGKCTASVQWPEPVATDVCDGLLPVHSTPTNGSVFNLGETTVICTAADLSGNSNACTFIVAVVDTEAPVLTNSPTNRLVYLVPPANDALVTWTLPDAIDNCEASMAVSCEPASGSRFPLGLTTVTCAASDSSGNNTNCTFTVTVASPQAPMITSIVPQAEHVQLTFTSVEGALYSIQETSNLLAGAWLDLQSEIVGTADTTVLTNLPPVDRATVFYRVELKP